MDDKLKGDRMTSPLSVLQKATKDDLRTSPFPYIVIRDALPAELYDRLATAFPSPGNLGIDVSKNNWRWNYGSAKVAKDPGLAQLWKDFIAYQSSPEFFHEIVELFYDGIHVRYPKQFPSLEYARRMRVGTRERDTFANKDVLMDAMISGNSPVQAASSVRTTHIDQGRKIFSGLFYMRRDEDDSVGGDLTISRFKPRYSDLASKVALFKGDYVDDQFVDVVETVPYSRNTLVLFINSIDSLHGVTVRQPTPHGRYFVNLVGEVVTRLYRRVKGRHYYVNLAWPVDAPVPPMSVLGERVMGLMNRPQAGD